MQNHKFCQNCWYSREQVKQKQKQLEEVQEKLNKADYYPEATINFCFKEINDLKAKQKQLLAFITAQDAVIDHLKAKQIQRIARLLITFLNDKDSSDS